MPKSFPHISTCKFLLSSPSFSQLSCSGGGGTAARQLQPRSADGTTAKKAVVFSPFSAVNAPAASPFSSAPSSVDEREELVSRGKSWHQVSFYLLPKLHHDSSMSSVWVLQAGVCQSISASLNAFVQTNAPNRLPHLSSKLYLYRAKMYRPDLEGSAQIKIGCGHTHPPVWSRGQRVPPSRCCCRLRDQPYDYHVQLLAFRTSLYVGGDIIFSRITNSLQNSTSPASLNSNLSHV